MNKHARIASLLAMALAFTAGCARQGESDEEPDAAATDAQGEASSANAAASEADLQKSLPPPQITPVTITVNLSPAAKAEFARTGESILLDVVYGGDPTQAGQSRVNELGVVELGRVKREVKDGEATTLSEDVLNKSLLEMTIGQPQLMVNVISAKKASPQNVLNCEFYWETLAVAGKNGVTIPCKLLSEAGG